MLIALTDSFPNSEQNAEKEFIRRFKAVAERAGHSAIEVTTSDDILDCKPDFVLCMHEFSPKLTPYTTIGVMWSPPAFSRNDPYRLRCIRSYDGYLVGSNEVRLFLEDLEFPSGVSKPKSDFRFLPVAQERPFEDCTRRTLAYLGIHWDGARHGDVIDTLIERNLITVYGPPQSWSRLTSGYGGFIPFDGVAVYETLGSHGMALCLHRDEHRLADTPSQRLFEAAAAGCLIVADEMSFTREVLGDNALYVDLSKPAQIAAETIARHVRWATANPDRASEMARRAHAILNREYSLEKLFAKTCEFAETVKRSSEAAREFVRGHRFGADTPADQPGVDVIIRCGGRSMDFLKRSLGSLEAQTVGPLRAILVDFKGRSDIEAFAREARVANVTIKYVQAPDNGKRSTALWTGLAEVSAPFFAVLDDDDYLMPEHFCGLLNTALHNPDASFIYSGVIRVEENTGYYHAAPNFNGPRGRVILEKRNLTWLDDFNIREVFHNNFICSHTWIAKSELLRDLRVMVDPLLQYAEDVYLYLMLAAKTRFVCSNQATAYWNWRSAERDNSMFQGGTDAWMECAERTGVRLGHLTFAKGVTLQDIRRAAQTPPPAPAGVIGDVKPKKQKKKKPNPLRRFLHSIPAYQDYREGRSQRRLRSRNLNGHAKT